MDRAHSREYSFKVKPPILMSFIYATHIMRNKVWTGSNDDVSHFFIPAVNGPIFFY